MENEIEEAALFDGTAVAVEERPEGIRITLPERLTGKPEMEEPDVIVRLKMKQEVKGVEDREIYFTGKE